MKTSFFTILLLTVLISITGCSSKPATFSDDHYKFEVQYSKKWEKTEYEAGTIVGFLTPLEENDQFQENVNITVKDFPELPLFTLQQYSQSLIREMKVLYNNIDFLDYQSGDIGGRPADRLIYRVNAEFPIKVMQAWMLRQKRVYTITYTAEEINFDKYIDEVEKVIESFRLMK